LFREKLFKDSLFLKSAQPFVTSSEIFFYKKNSLAGLINNSISGNKTSTDLYLNYSDVVLYDKEATAFFLNLFSQFSQKVSNSVSFLLPNSVKNCVFTNYTILYKKPNIPAYKFNIENCLFKMNFANSFIGNADNFIFKK